MTAQGNNQGGGNQSGGSGSSSSSRQSSGQGGSQYEDSRMDPNHKDYDPNWRPGPVGAVEDEANDGRLKENREAGRTKGTTAHSSQAPYVDKDNSNSINAQDGEFSGNDQSNQGQSGGTGGGSNNS